MSEQLWCCHVDGPDDTYPAPDRETAEAWATMLNAFLARHSYEFSASAAPWPWSPEAHAKGLPAAVRAMTPRRYAELPLQ